VGVSEVLFLVSFHDEWVSKKTFGSFFNYQTGSSFYCCEIVFTAILWDRFENSCSGRCYVSSHFPFDWWIPPLIFKFYVLVIYHFNDSVAVENPFVAQNHPCCENSCWLSKPCSFPSTKRIYFSTILRIDHWYFLPFHSILSILKVSTYINFPLTAKLCFITKTPFIIFPIQLEFLVIIQVFPTHIISL